MANRSGNQPQSRQDEQAINRRAAKTPGGSLPGLLQDQPQRHRDAEETPNQTEENLLPAFSASPRLGGSLPCGSLPGLRRSASRSGVSLLEVLISIFVLMFGLLGVAALLPVGRFELAEAAKRDRAAVVGRAVLRDIQVRGLIDPFQWYAYYGGSWQNVPTGEPTLAGPYFAYAIDPSYISRTLADQSAADSAIASYPSPATPVFLGRAFWLPPGMALPTTPAQWRALNEYCNRVCTWHDDLLFQTPDDKAARPYELLRQSDGNTNTAAGMPANAILGESEGNYSWMLTVSPSTSEFGWSAQDRKTFNVSVVVFYKRDMSPPGTLDNDGRPSEQPTSVHLLSGGIGGGEVEFNATPTILLKKGDWVCLLGTPGQGRICNWYRVLSTSVAASGKTRATLAGPDWVGGDPANAVIVSNVVGVYCETVEIKRTW
jgi:hypothetical protein